MKPAIEITNACNLNCEFCPYRYDKRKTGKIGYMKMDVFKQLIDTLESQTEEFMLFNRGEPFMHHMIYEMIEYANAKKPVIIATNGTLVNVEQLYAIPGKKTIAVSIQAGDRKTYKKITGADMFNRVKKTLIELQEKEPNDVYVYSKLVKCKSNNGQITNVKRFAKNLVVVEDSNQPNPFGFEDCTQPVLVPTWSWDGQRRVCCRSQIKYSVANLNKGLRRQLKDCKNCAIR